MICKLPEYPKTEVRGTAIVVLYEDGKEEIWGDEPNEAIATEVAKDIELGLKAIDYTSLEITRKINKIAEDLVSLGIPHEYTNDYLCEGYLKIAKWFEKLEPFQVIG